MTKERELPGERRPKPSSMVLALAEALMLTQNQQLLKLWPEKVRENERKPG